MKILNESEFTSEQLIEAMRGHQVLTAHGHGRQMGDVFLALFGSQLLRDKHGPLCFLTHVNHQDVCSLFSDYLDLLVLSHNPWQYYQSGCVSVTNIQNYAAPDLPYPSNAPWGHPHYIGCPWWVFINNGTKPFELRLNVPAGGRRLEGKNVIFYPQRSENNEALPVEFLAPIAEFAKNKGYAIFTNDFCNSVYTYPAIIPGTKPLGQYSLAEAIHLGRNPETVIVGTRSGIMDVFYFTGMATMVVFTPRSMKVCSHRFREPRMIAMHPERFYDRPRCFEFPVESFSLAALMEQEIF